MTKRELQKLKANMPPKYRNTLSREFNVTEAYIDMIFRGAYVRIDIIDKGIELAVEHKKMLQEQKERIKSL